jgi:hypothetical protein
MEAVMKTFLYFLTCLSAVVVILCLGIDAQALTKEEADSILCYEVIGIDTVSHELIAFGFDSALAVGITIFPFWPEPLPDYVDSGFYCESPHINTEPTWFYWVDDNPYASFVHETRYVYITDSTVTVTVDTGYWWPVVDSVEWWHADSAYWDTTNWVCWNVSYIPPHKLWPIPPEQPHKLQGLEKKVEEVCAMVLQGDEAAWFGENYTSMKSAFESFGFRVRGLKVPAPRKDVLDSLAAFCANVDCPCIWIYATSHGGVTTGGKHYLDWGGAVLSSDSIESKLNNCDEKKVCLTVQGCHSGEMIDDLGSHARIKIITTSTNRTTPSYTADPDRNWDPNPWDKGSEYTYGFEEDLKIIQGNTTAMRVARKLAQDNNTCVCEALGFEAHNTALGKDEWFNDGGNPNPYKEYPQQNSASSFPVVTCEVGIGVGQQACVVFGGKMRKRTVCWSCDNHTLPQWSWKSGCANCPPCGTNCNCTAVPAGTQIKIGGTVVPENTVVSNIPATGIGVANHYKVEIESDSDGCICLKLDTQSDTCTKQVHNSYGQSARRIVITTSGSNGTLRNCVVTGNPPGCPTPSCYAVGDTIDIDWGDYFCFDSCETVEFTVEIDFPCGDLQIESVDWTFPAPPESTFTLNVTPSPLYTTPGDPPVHYTADIGAVLGYSLPVTLDLASVSPSPAPGTITAVFSPNGQPCPYSSDAAVTADALAPYGTYTLTMRGTGSDGQVRTKDVTLIVQPPFDEVDVPFFHGSQKATNFGAVANDAASNNFLWYGLTAQLFDGSFIIATTDASTICLDVYDCVHHGWTPDSHINLSYDSKYNDNVAFGTFYSDLIPGEWDSVFFVGIMETCVDFSIKIKVYYNVGPDPIYGLYPALYEDWDVGDFYNNLVVMDTLHNLMYQYDVADPNIVFGMMKAPFYDDLMHNIVGVSNPRYVYPNAGFCADWGLDSLYYLISTPGYYNTATSATDMSQLMTALPIDLNPGDRHIEVWIDFGRNLGDGLTWQQWWHRVLRYTGFYRGDVNASDTLEIPASDVSDLVYLIQYLFKNGPAPLPYIDQGDVNADGIVNIADVVYLINYVFIHGPAPVDYVRFIPQKWTRPSLFENPNWR